MNKAGERVKPKWQRRLELRIKDWEDLKATAVGPRPSTKIVNGMAYHKPGSESK